MEDKNKDLISELENFGLTDTEAEIYLYLVNNPPKTVLEMSKVLGIPRSTIYDNIKFLKEKEFITEILGSRGYVYEASPISSLDRLADLKIKKAESLRKSADLLKDRVKPHINPLTETRIKYYYGIAGFKQIIWNSLSAKGEMVGYSIFGRIDVTGTDFYEKYRHELLVRKIKDRVLSNPTKRIINLLNRWILESDHHLGVDDIRIIEKDIVNVYGDTMIYNSTFAQLYWMEGEIAGFEIESPLFVKTQKSIFEGLWREAESLKSFLEKYGKKNRAQ